MVAIKLPASLGGDNAAMDIQPIAAIAASTATEPTPSAARGAAPQDAGAGFGTLLTDRRAGAAVAEPQPTGFKQLETLLVQQMLETVLTSEEGGFFGEGLGGDYYAGFLAEHFGARLAEGLDLGLATQLGARYGSEEPS